MAAFAHASCLADWRRLAGLRHLALEIVERTMLDDHDRAVPLQGGNGQAFRVVGKCRHHHGQAGKMRQRPVRALGVRDNLAPTLADDGAHHKRHVAGIAVEHVSPLGRQVDELVKC